MAHVERAFNRRQIRTPIGLRMARFNRREDSHSPGVIFSRQRVAFALTGEKETNGRRFRSDCKFR